MPFSLQAAPSNLPPPAEIASLAEQLAPLIKANPSLPQADKPAITKPHKQETLSPVEDAFSQRAGQRLVLFGYNQIGKQVSEAPTTGQVQDDVILGAGDRINVTFRGQRDDSKNYIITPQGDLIISGLDPIAASGLTIGALRTRLEQETARNLLNSTVFISVQSLRQIAITVMGEVQRPGVYTLNPFQTVLDALALSKGITKNGSLRNVKLLRGGKSISLDFYQLLLQGNLGTPLQLRDGDKIMVPVLGQTIAVAGDVKRPGIFERPASGTEFTFNDALALSGGPVRPGANQFVKLSLNAWGDEKVTDLYSDDSAPFKDGDMLMVSGGTPMRTNGIQLVGHIRQPGPRSLEKTPDLKTLISNPRLFREGIYPLIGIIERTNPKTLTPVLSGFSPGAVLQGRENKKLQDRDRILFFSSDDIRSAMKPKQKQENKPVQTATFIDIEKDPLASLNKKKPTAPRNPLLTKEVVDFLTDHAATISGAVLQPGLYPVSGTVALKDILDVAGGLKPDAETAHIDVLFSNPNGSMHRNTMDLSRNVSITARDKITIPSSYTAAETRGIEIVGEVLRPGKYDLRKGDTLIDLIDRAGGMTNLAFAEGTIFTRESERQKQEAQFRNAARSLDMAVAGYFLKKDAANDHAEEIKNAQNIAAELRNVRAVGRITVEANPDILHADPQLAMLLQPGDKIYVPRRSPTVTIAGEVMSPLVLRHEKGMQGYQYIQRAGGMTRYADRSRNFIVFPDGSATPLSGSSGWFGSKDGIPAGSTLVVPRDPDPLDFLKVAESIGNILSQMAITSVASAQLSRPYY